MIPEASFVRHFGVGGRKNGQEADCFCRICEGFCRSNRGKLDVSMNIRLTIWPVACVFARAPAALGVETSWSRLGKKELSSRDCGGELRKDEETGNSHS
jgi:hypothetical protein